MLLSKGWVKQVEKACCFLQGKWMEATTTLDEIAWSLVDIVVANDKWKFGEN